MVVTLLPIVLAVLGVASADYLCTCSRADKTTVYGRPDESSQPVGYLYSFDCKENLPGRDVPGWKSVAISHIVAYVMDTNDTETKSCPGEPVFTDQVGIEEYTTSAAATSTPMPDSTTPATTTEPSTTAAPTTTPASTTSRPFAPGNVDHCPSVVRHSVHPTAQFEQNCYVLIDDTKSWQSAEHFCGGYNGGHLAYISNSAEQDFIMQFLHANNYNKEVWIGLYDRGHEEDFRWTSGTQLSYTNWYPNRKDDIDSHVVEDCGILNPSPPFNGEWDDVRCGSTNFLGLALHPERQHGSICQTNITDSQHQQHQHHHHTGAPDFDNLFSGLIG